MFCEAKIACLKQFFKAVVLAFVALPCLLYAQDDSHSGVEGRPANESIINPAQSVLTPYQYLLQSSHKKTLWFEQQAITLSGLSLHRLLADLGWHEVVKIKNLFGGDYQQHDRMLTNGFLQLISIVRGSVDANIITAEEVLLAAINENTTDELLHSLIPAYDQITHLRKAITQYRLLSLQQWPKLDVNFRPRLGQSHRKIASIRQILTKLGDLPQKAQTQARFDVFDSVVEAALKQFQQRHGLTVDGQLGPKTYSALQVTPKQRIQQLQVNLWRWFSLPHNPPEKYLMVNIPGYQLSVIENGKQALQMKVIVGDNENPTPQIITEINRVTLNPTWTPTVNIINKELIPEYQLDYLSLQRKNFQLVKGYSSNIQIREIDDPNLNLPKLLKSYRLVQAAGNNNALGFYRFNIPNNYSVYLHDTPVKSLFRQSNRALSHGCIRLEYANLLAKYLLKAERYIDADVMQPALKSGKTTHLALDNPLPVYITYQTAWINNQGDLRISPDIYQLDNKNTLLTQFQSIVSNPVITLSQNKF